MFLHCGMQECKPVRANVLQKAYVVSVQVQVVPRSSGVCKNVHHFVTSLDGPVISAGLSMFP